MEHGDLFSKVYQVLSIGELQKKVNQAPELSPFDFLRMAGGESRVSLMSGSSAIVKDKEQGVEEAFELSLDLPQQYSLLKALQKLEFDIYQIVSMPKSEKYCIAHDNLPNLDRFLSGQDKPRARKFPALRNKVVSPAIRQHGRLHVRFYDHGTDPSKLVATAHIDPPDPNHLNISKHLRGEVDTDYEKGTELFQKVLEFLQGNQGNPKVA